MLQKNCVNEKSTCQKIPSKGQPYVKVGENDVHSIKELKLWVRLNCFSFHCCSVSSKGFIVNFVNC